MSTTENKIKNNNLGSVIGSFGASTPLLSINDYIISNTELLSMELNTFDNLPTIYVIMKCTSGIFLSRHFPKDGDVISLFVRSFNNLFKPIKCDFLITQIDSTMSKDSEGNQMVFYINGVLNIPNLFSDRNICLKDKTSVEALTQISNDLGLGFASNELDVDDKMSWRTSNNYLEFIQDIANHAYKDDNSFFDAFIDYYYNINFVNLAKNFSIADNFEVFEGLIQGGFLNDTNAADSQFQKAKNVLTNSPEARASSQYFNSYLIKNISGFNNSIYCYNNHLYFYDYTLNEIVDFKVSPFKTKDSEKNKIVMLGRPGEDFYKDNNRNIWLGFQQSDSSNSANVHPFWNLSYIQNLYNREEVKKMHVEVDIPQANFNLYKGMVIPVLFMVQDQPQRVKVAGNVDDNGKVAGATLDRFLTGNYVIGGIKLIYRKTSGNIGVGGEGMWSQQIKIQRREWTFPNSPKHEYSDSPLDWSKNYAL